MNRASNITRLIALKRACDKLEQALDAAEVAYFKNPSERRYQLRQRLGVRCDRAWDKLATEELKQRHG